MSAIYVSLTLKLILNLICPASLQLLALSWIYVDSANALASTVGCMRSGLNLIGRFSINGKTN